MNEFYVVLGQHIDAAVDGMNSSLTIDERERWTARLSALRLLQTDFRARCGHSSGSTDNSSSAPTSPHTETR